MLPHINLSTCILLGGLACLAPPARAELLVGTSTTSITPTGPVAVSGQFQLRIAHKVESPVLAHHRFLRHPNMDPFHPILEKDERISKDPTVMERTKRYRLGL